MDVEANGSCIESSCVNVNILLSVLAAYSTVSSMLYIIIPLYIQRCVTIMRSRLIIVSDHTSFFTYICLLHLLPPL